MLFPLFALGTLLTAGISAAGSMKSAEAKARADEQEADQNWEDAAIADRNSAIVLSQATQEERKFRVMGRRQIGSMKASIGASGLQGDGNALDLLQESATTIEDDALSIRAEGSIKAGDYRRQSARDRTKAIGLRAAAADVRTAGWLGAAGDLVGAGAAIYDKALRPASTSTGLFGGSSSQGLSSLRRTR